MKVLIIDDEMNICLSVKNILSDENFICDYALNANEGLKKFEEDTPDIVLLDVRLDGMNGLDLLKKLKTMNPQVPVIMISGHSGISEAVEAMKLGAYDFLEKPLSMAKVKVTVSKAYEFKMMSLDYQRLKNKVDAAYQIIGESKPIKILHVTISKVAQTDAKILLRGESGTGKELVAYAIHTQSKRNKQPFIKFNSAAIPSELVESELFGYDKGAFTGAVSNKEGKLEQANNGTLFLDEIGDMNLTAQAKILRVIQEGEFERVGSNKTRKINTRIVAATHKDLEKLVQKGEFREDLYYRLNVIPINVPPLRERAEDIPLLVDHFSRYFSQELQIPQKKFTPETIRLMQSWEYKGNVRELRNLIERIYILIEEAEITPELIENLCRKESIPEFWNQTKPFKDIKREFEYKYLSTQLKMNDNSLSKTAEALELQVSNLSRKLKDLGIKN